MKTTAFSLFNERPVGTAFRRGCTELKIEDLHFHDLRHEGTSRLFEAGFTIEQVALVTGHKDWKMLRRYRATSLAAINAAMLRIAKHIAEAVRGTRIAPSRSRENVVTKLVVRSTGCQTAVHGLDGRCLARPSDRIGKRTRGR